MRKFKVGDLFELKKVSNKLAKGDLSDKYEFPTYSSDTGNNGIIGYSNNPEFLCNEKTPVYVIFGDHTRTFNIARKSFSVLDNVKVLVPCSNNDEVLLYITNVWQKQIPNLGYARHWKIAKDCTISLPVQTDNNNIPIIDPNQTYHPKGYIPDWEYMESYIRKLEQEHIRELKQYLIVSGLNDYELTDEDKEILATRLKEEGDSQNPISENSCLKEARMFRVGDLFVSQSGNTDLQKRNINGKGYYIVSSGRENNGIIGKTNVPAKIFNANTITVDMFGNCFYQIEPYKMVTHARVFSLSPLFDGLNKHSGQYIVSQLKYLSNIYSYSDMCSWKKIENDKLHLPIQTDCTNTPSIDQNHIYHPDGYIPDWKYMEKYIRAIKKVVIKDVVSWINSKIEKAAN